MTMLVKGQAKCPDARPLVTILLASYPVTRLVMRCVCGSRRRPEDGVHRVQEGEGLGTCCTVVFFAASTKQKGGILKNNNRTADACTLSPR